MISGCLCGKRKRRIAMSGVTLALVISLIGCGGNRLIPRDLKDCIAADLKIPRRNVELTQIFRTTIMLRVNPMSLSQARQAERDLITTCFEYFRVDNVTDFINDTLVFVVRLDTDADVNLKWTSVALDANDVLKEQMSLETFFDRCNKEENWVSEF